MHGPLRSVLNLTPWLSGCVAAAGGAACGLAFLVLLRQSVPEHYLDSRVSFALGGMLLAFLACEFVRFSPVENWRGALLTIVIVSAIYALRLGTHSEDDDRMGGGQTVSDFEPSSHEYAIDFAKEAVQLSWGVLIGTIAGPKKRDEVARRITR